MGKRISSILLSLTIMCSVYILIGEKHQVKAESNYDSKYVHNNEPINNNQKTILAIEQGESNQPEDILPYPTDSPIPDPLSNDGVVNTAKTYTGVSIFDILLNMGYTKWNVEKGNYWTCGLKEINSGDNINFEVRSDVHDFSVTLESPSDETKNNFRTMTDILIPGHGKELYESVLSVPERGSETFSIGGRTVKVINVRNIYDIFFSPYDVGTVKVNSNRTFTGRDILPKLIPMGFFMDKKVEGWARTNKYGQTGAINFEAIDFGVSSGQWDAVMIIFVDNEEVEQHVHEIFNMLLTNQGGQLYEILDDSNLTSHQVSLDGRRIDIIKYSWGLELTFGPIIQ